MLFSVSSGGFKFKEVMRYADQEEIKVAVPVEMLADHSVRFVIASLWQHVVPYFSCWISTG
jgi:hypothetical protein